MTVHSYSERAWHQWLLLEQSLLQGYSSFEILENCVVEKAAVLNCSKTIFSYVKGFFADISENSNCVNTSQVKHKQIHIHPFPLKPTYSKILRLYHPNYYVLYWSLGYSLEQLQRCSWLPERRQQIFICCSPYLTLDQQVVFSVARITGVANLPQGCGLTQKSISFHLPGLLDWELNPGRGGTNWCSTTELSTHPYIYHPK